jgi:hypothetical protein
MDSLDWWRSSGSEDGTTSEERPAKRDLRLEVKDLASSEAILKRSAPTANYLTGCRKNAKTEITSLWKI